jgi:Ser/Thr protein kinase RdoA (MazF antagonist)
MLRFVSREEVRLLLKKTFNDSFTLKSLAGGLLNHNFIVGTKSAKFVLKIYRSEITREKLDETHRIMAHCVKRDIPVSLPMATCQVADHVAALYPFIEGTAAPKFKNSIRNVEHMGEMLGRVDKALDTFKSMLTKPPSIELARWDVDNTLKDIVEIRRAAKRRRVDVRDTVETTLHVYERILAAGDWDKTRFAKLPVKLCHNDFHGGNLVVRDNNIVAVLDWEKAGWEWRAFEIMRSITFNCRKSDRELDWNLVRAYISGYRKHESFTTIERELAYDAGVYKMFFSLWAIKQYLAGHMECKANVLRRARLLPYLFKHRKEFTDRIANLLT